MAMTKIKIQIENRFTGSVLFEYEKENNTIKETIEKAVERGAYLGGADLCGADLRDADLRGADLRDADLRGADLRGADLCGADLRDADLGGAYLCGADLCGADLGGADLRGAEDVKFPLACPSDGAFIGWKKVRHQGKTNALYLVKLEIPEDARRSSATTEKCRCDKAKVLEITPISEGTPQLSEVENHNEVKTIYKVGEMVFSDSFDENRWKECSHGIHFFINKQSAIDYLL